jgi:outer membrane biosynthesis protein TonB
MNDTRPLLLGLVLSVAFHVAVVIPLLDDAAAATDAGGIVDLATAIEPPQPEEEETVLGIDDSMAKTMNWIGYEDYEEHLARLADMDQAAFKMNPSAGGGAPPPTPRPTPPTEETTPEAPKPRASATPPSVTAPPAEDDSLLSVPEAPLPTPAERIEPATPEKPDPEAPREEVGPPEPESPPVTDPKPEAPPREPTPPTEPKPETPPQEPAPPGEPKPEPAEGPGSGEGEPADGDAAEKESDATSVIEVPPSTWRAGRPLAANGLELKTRRPVFPELTKLTAQFSNPLVEISIGRNGRPRNVVILESSRDRRVDEPIIDSLYRWRATGERLQELEGDETVTIRIRIMLQ